MSDFLHCLRFCGCDIFVLSYTLVKDMAADVEVGQVGIEPPEFGWFVDQQEASLELGAWVDLRRNIIKRPFLATSEKFIDTCG